MAQQMCPRCVRSVQGGWCPLRVLHNMIFKVFVLHKMLTPVRASLFVIKIFHMFKIHYLDCLDSLTLQRIICCQITLIQKDICNIEESKPVVV